MRAADLTLAAIDEALADWQRIRQAGAMADFIRQTIGAVLPPWQLHVLEHIGGARESS